MSAAGTPSSDPWVVLVRERTRYEEQFRSLKPVNGIVTGDQAKGFLLQSQLPPAVLGQIWGLADTDADGKMDINEFSIACKLINLKLRGFEVPKVLPPSLLASLKAFSAPAIPPLPNASLMSAPSRPEPPKVASVAPQQPLLSNNLISGMNSNVPVVQAQPMGGLNLLGGVPTGIVPPMQNIPNAIPPSIPPLPTSVPPMQPNLPIIPPMQASLPPMQPSLPPMQPLLMQNSTLPAQTNVNMGGVLPPQPLIGSVAPLGGSQIPMQPTIPPVAMIPNAIPPLVPGVPPLIPNAVPLGNVPVGTSAPIVPNSTSTPLASNTPRASVTSIERANSIESPQVDWAVPQMTKLKYTQIFNTTDRTRSGYLSGPQARNLMVQSKLPQNTLAQIWALSDMDADGRLGCEEFVLAMHLCEQATLGQQPPVKLPPDLIPPSFRRPTRSVSRTASISSQGSAPQDLDPASTLLQTSFEDKRKENFEKGQAELDRRRKTLLDQQRKEAEERERKEREEVEKREKARQEVERKRIEELEKQMREQQEQERLKEEERKRQADQREAARKEMERQRQLEWEKLRLQELQQQRQREQENVLKLKAKNQSLTIELGTLNEQVRDLSQKICDTRLGVSNVKSTIDGMRTTRDQQMQEMSQLKNKLKEQNARLLTLSQEKIKLDARNKMNTANQDSEQARIAFENKEITIKNLREKVADMQKEIDGKLNDIDNNNSQLNDLKNQLKSLLTECEGLYMTYDQKRNIVLDMKRSNKPVDYQAAWSNNDSAWGNDTNEADSWPVDNWATSTDNNDVGGAGEADTAKYRALYEFVARNNDEISFQPGDIINVPKSQNAEPGWLAGEIRGHTGWFPETYAEPVDGIGINPTPITEQPIYAEIPESKPLEGIAEVPESTESSIETTTIPNQFDIEPQVVEHYMASYLYESQEPGDLTFKAGEIIEVIKKDGEWWTGRVNGVVGIFPSNYVTKVETPSAPNSANSTSAVFGNEPSQVDNEVSQINEISSLDKSMSIDASTIANAQIMKGKKPEIASVIAPYQATSPEQLSLARGQLIMIRKKTDSGWWEGELQAKGRKRQVGWFPASYVKVLNSSGRTSGRNTPVSTSRMQQEVIIDKVIALYSYTAGNPDELTFAKDDIISVTAREEDAWWRGELNGISGLFPSNYVTPLQQQQYEVFGLNKGRNDAVNEFIETEKVYVHDLLVVSKVFQKPLKENSIIPEKDINNIFLNWQEILICNKVFLKALKHRHNTGHDTFGDLIVDHLPNMTPYIMFCTKQLDSTIHLQKLTENCTALKNFLKQCLIKPVAKGLPLSSYLIKPMQRITKYPLMIKKIIEHTPQNHPDFGYLQQALRVSEGFLKCINENIRVKETMDRMDWLQTNIHNDINIEFRSNTNKLGPRQLIHYGPFTKLKNGKELLGFLFNDFFIFVQSNKPIGSQFNFSSNTNITYKIYRQPIMIQDLSVSQGCSDSVEPGTDSNRILKLVDESTKYSIQLIVSSVNECSLWIKHIESIKSVYNKVLEFMNAKPGIQASPIRRCGRLRVIVERGIRFICNGKSYIDNIYCKVTLGYQEQTTNIAKDNLSNGNMIFQKGVPPVPALIWNYTMHFQLHNINEDVITFAIFELNNFTPDTCLGRAELKVVDVIKEIQYAQAAVTKRLVLHKVESGEIVVKFDVQMFND